MYQTAKRFAAINYFINLKEVKYGVSLGFTKSKDRCRLSWGRIQWDQYHVYINL